MAMDVGLQTRLAWCCFTSHCERNGTLSFFPHAWRFSEPALASISNTEYRFTATRRTVALFPESLHVMRYRQWRLSLSSFKTSVATLPSDPADWLSSSVA